MIKWFMLISEDIGVSPKVKSVKNNKLIYFKNSLRQRNKRDIPTSKRANPKNLICSPIKIIEDKQRITVTKLSAICCFLVMLSRDFDTSLLY